MEIESCSPFHGSPPSWAVRVRELGHAKESRAKDKSRTSLLVSRECARTNVMVEADRPSDLALRCSTRLVAIPERESWVVYFGRAGYNRASPPADDDDLLEPGKAPHSCSIGEKADDAAEI